MHTLRRCHTQYDESNKMALSTGQKLGSSLLRKVGLDILDGLTVANAVQLHFFEKKITIAEVLNVKWEE